MLVLCCTGQTLLRKLEMRLHALPKNVRLMPTPVFDVPYLHLKDIKHQQKSHSLQASSAVTSHECAPSVEQLSAFYTELGSCSKKSILLSTVAPHNVEFVQSIDHLPRAFQGLHDPNNIKLNFRQLLELIQQFKESVSSAMRDHLEVITQTQASCRKCMKYRAGRVTASNPPCGGTYKPTSTINSAFKELFAIQRCTSFRMMQLNGVACMRRKL